MNPSRPRRRVLLAALALAGGAARAHGDAPRHERTAPPEQQPWGIAGDPAHAQRRIELRMADTMRFTPARIDVREGETVRLVVHNDGAHRHELVLGTATALREHAALMRRHPDMEHDEPWMAHVAPGTSAEIVWTFNRAGDYAFGCLVAGHFEAGMSGRIHVRTR